MYQNFVEPAPKFSPTKELIEDFIDVVIKYRDFVKYKEAELEVKKWLDEAYELDDLSDEEIVHKTKDSILDYFESDVGKYLTALIHASKGKEFIFSLESLNEQGVFLNSVGEYLKDKKLTLNGNLGNIIGAGMVSGELVINGNVGYCLGVDMKGGKIIINGDAGRVVGKTMNGGVIIINGNIGDNLGILMKDGKIIVNGDAGGNIGQGASNSEIYIKGNFKYLSDVIYEGTTIYQEKEGKWVKIFPLK